MVCRLAAKEGRAPGRCRPLWTISGDGRDAAGAAAMRLLRLAEPGSSPLSPPRNTGGALGGIFGLLFAPAADGQQQGRLAPIGFCFGGFFRSRGASTPAPPAPSCVSTPPSDQ